MNESFTPGLSDKLLEFLVEKIPLGDYDDFTSHDFPVSEEISVDALDVLLDDLKERELIEILSRGHSGYDYSYEISINKKAIDWLQQGGFSSRELNLASSLKELVNELETLTDIPSERKEKIIALIREINNFLIGPNKAV